MISFLSQFSTQISFGYPVLFFIQQQFFFDIDTFICLLNDQNQKKKNCQQKPGKVSQVYCKFCVIML